MALWSALAVGGILPSVGCQVEYAGMTLPSGKYMHDDVQYFPAGPEFPWANTQAATQRARMRAMGIEPPPEGGAVAPTPAPGGINPVQNQFGRPTDINRSPLDVIPPAQNVPAPPAPGLAPGGPEVTAPGAVPAPPAPGRGAAPAPGGAGRVPPPPPPGGAPEPDPNP
ncbi:MAG: hypothetical protein U0790_03035 [Isosphaeraceae bacterium]